MADDTIETTPPNERIAFIEAELARTVEKRDASRQRTRDLEEQVTRLNAQLETEYDKIEPAQESSPGEE